jgi:hypothetical protein
VKRGKLLHREEWRIKSETSTNSSNPNYPTFISVRIFLVLRQKGQDNLENIMTLFNEIAVVTVSFAVIDKESLLRPTPFFLNNPR